MNICLECEKKLNLNIYFNNVGNNAGNKNWKFKIVAILIGTMIGFALVEGFLRWRGLGYDHAGFEADALLHHRHKHDYYFINDHPPNPNVSGVEVYYDSLGCVASGQPRLGQKKLALIGDSFTEGVQVSYDSSFAGILENQLRKEYQVFNFGVGGYSPVIYNLMWDAQVKSLNPDVVVIQLYKNDIQDDSTYFRKATFNVSGGIIGIDGGDIALFRRFVRNFYTFRFIRKYYLRWMYEEEQSSSKRSKVKYSIDVENSLTVQQFNELIGKVRASGADIMVFLVPRKSNESLGFNAQMERVIQKDSTIKYLDAEMAFKKARKGPYFFEKDIHFNTNGHRVIADLIINEVMNDEKR